MGLVCDAALVRYRSEDLFWHLVAFHADATIALSGLAPAMSLAAKEQSSGMSASMSLTMEEIMLMQAKLDEGRELMESAHAATQLNEQRALDLAEAEASLARREAEAEAALRDAASQMAAAQDIAQRAREQEAEAKVAVDEGVADLKAEVEQLVGSKETELGAAEAARLDAEADAAVEKATAASERARADAMREVAWKMESELEAMSAQAEVGLTLF